MFRALLREDALAAAKIGDRRGVPARGSVDGRERNDSQEALALVDAIPPLHGERSDRTVYLGIAATMRRRFGVGCERGISCRGLPCVVPGTGAAWAGGGGS